MFELVYKDRDQEAEAVIPLDREELVIGRSPKADLSLSDYGISRFHAKIVCKGNEVSIQDLESRNGTKVNDVLVMQAQLRPGDQITLGSFTLRVRVVGVEEHLAGVDATDESREISEASGTIIRSHDELEKLLAAAEGGRAAAPKLDDIERSNRILRMLTQVAKALISEDTLDGILRKVMDLVFENIPAERGVLGLYEGDELSLRVVSHRRATAEGEKITIPKAITNKVRRDKVSILTMDAQEDQRFDASHSILLLGIRSAMCVPLWNQGNVIGIIYVDEDIRAGTFNTNDLDLLSALANYAAVAIERTRLNQKIQEEQATREKLARYHSPGVIERILSSGASDSLEMQERVVTVCFADIVGFTSLAENLEPRAVGAVINEFFTELTECIFKYEGTLDKYIGDCIMAVFGAPIPQEDHALRCVRAVLEMYETLERLNQDRSDGRSLQLRTGINSGKVVAGDIGSPKRKDYSVLGDAVNLASRLESTVAKPGWIVIGEATYEEVKEYFDCEYLGSQSVKGKKREVGSYRVLGQKAGAVLP